MKKTALLALATASLLLSGCALFQEKPVTEVNDSQLNWMVVRYHPADQQRKPCFINILSVGSIEFRQGRSPLVFDSFSQDVDNPLWGDIESEKLGVTPDQARWILQLFVDAGLTTESRRMRRLSSAEKGKTESGIAIFTAKLNNKKYHTATNSPKLIDTLERVIEAIAENRGFH